MILLLNHSLSTWLLLFRVLLLYVRTYYSITLMMDLWKVRKQRRCSLIAGFSIYIYIYIYVNSVLSWPHDAHTHAVHKMFPWPYRPDAHRSPSDMQSSSSYSERAAHMSNFCFLFVGQPTGGLCWYKSSCLQHVVFSASSSWTEIFIKYKCEDRRGKSNPVFTKTLAYK